MRRPRLALAALAVGGWLAALLTQMAVLLPADEARRTRWKQTRNRFLLVSSIATNSLVLSAVLRYLRNRGNGGTT